LFALVFIDIDSVVDPTKILQLYLLIVHHRHHRKILYIRVYYIGPHTRKTTTTCKVLQELFSLTHNH